MVQSVKSKPATQACPRTVLYFSGNLNSAKSTSPFDAFKRYASNLPKAVDLYAEEYTAHDSTRPLWKEILLQVSQGKIQRLIVPSVAHLVSNASGLLMSLEFAHRHGVVVISLAQKKFGKSKKTKSSRKLKQPRVKAVRA